jgi:hypothetical protein
MVLGSACDEGTAQDLEVSFRSENVNTPTLQGPALVINGPGLGIQGPGLGIQGPGLGIQGPGLGIQGPWLQFMGVSFFNGPGLGIQGPGLGIQGITLEGSLLNAVITKDGATYPMNGTDLIGAEFDLRLQVEVNGQTTIEQVFLRFDNIVQSPQQDDVYLYHMTYRPASSPTWLPYCGDNGVGAIPFKGIWNQSTGDRIDDPNLFTFGCANAALGKCALWGYRPWATATLCPDPDKQYSDKQKAKKCQTISLQDHHQACTRMARADYCGNGTPATVNGTLIDIWDTLAPPIQTEFTDWPVEAEWGPDGATCMNYMRHPEFGYPACFLDKKGNPKKFSDCGTNKKQRSQLINAFNKPGSGGGHDSCGDD